MGETSKRSPMAPSPPRELFFRSASANPAIDNVGGGESSISILENYTFEGVHHIFEHHVNASKWFSTGTFCWSNANGEASRHDSGLVKQFLRHGLTAYVILWVTTVIDLSAHGQCRWVEAFCICYMSWVWLGVLSTTTTGQREPVLKDILAKTAD